MRESDIFTGRPIVSLAILTAMAVVCSVASAAPEGKEIVTAAKADPSKYKFALVKTFSHPYFTPMDQAVKDAARDFDIPEPLLQAPLTWNQNDQNKVLDELVAKGVKAIGLCTCDPVAGNEKITQLVDSGVPVITFAMSPALPSKASFCLATDVGNSAYQGAKHLIEAMGKKGRIVHLTGNASDGNTKKRMEGVEKAVSEYKDVKLIQTIQDIDFAEPAQKEIGNLMATKRSEIDGIICTAYIPATTIATEVRHLGEKRIKILGVDTDKIVLDAIRDGYFVGTMSQNPYGQAYVSIYSMKLLMDGYTWKKDAPFQVDSGTLFVDRSNLVKYEKTQVQPFPLMNLTVNFSSENYQQTFKKLSKEFLKDWAEKYFDKPSGK